MPRAMRACLLVPFIALSALPVRADTPQIVAVDLERVSMGWRVAVTLAHPDTGWDHYADGWEVLDAEGNRLGYRRLHHPHVDEQPFTRSLNSVMPPDGAQEVFIRARCSVDGWAPGAPLRVPLR